MKRIKLNLKVVALFLATLILFQGCTVYKSANVSLNEAAQSNLKIKIIKNNGDKEKFSKVELWDDGQFYGRKKIFRTRRFENILIERNTVKKVLVQDKKASTIISIAIPLVILGSMAYALRDGIKVDLTN